MTSCSRRSVLGLFFLALPLGCERSSVRSGAATQPESASQKAVNSAAASASTRSAAAPNDDSARSVAGEGADPSAAHAPLLALSIQPLGADLPDPAVTLVKDALLAFYDLDVRVAPRVPLPKLAYYAKRGRYRAEKLLDFLEAGAPKNVFRTLGLTAVDISTTKGSYEDWGVLGLGTIDGGTCVISSFRTTRGASGPEHARIRLAKTAVHEIGHTLGLEHCPNAGCLMQDGQGTVFTTDGEYDLCADCRAKLEARGHRLAHVGAIPWPRPTPG